MADAKDMIIEDLRKKLENTTSELNRMKQFLVDKVWHNFVARKDWFNCSLFCFNVKFVQLLYTILDYPMLCLHLTIRYLNWVFLAC